VLDALPSTFNESCLGFNICDSFFADMNGRGKSWFQMFQSRLGILLKLDNSITFLQVNLPSNWTRKYPYELSGFVVLESLKIFENFLCACGFFLEIGLF
jgi:hypothetical protein